MIRGIQRKTYCIFLCLVAVFLWSSFASAGRPSHKAKYAKKKVEKSVDAGKTGSYKERSAIVSIPSSDVFSRNSQGSERVTEVLLGDEFTVIKEDKDWAYGYIPSQKGYRGWIKKDNISFSSPISSPGKIKPLSR